MYPLIHSSTYLYINENTCPCNWSCMHSACGNVTCAWLPHVPQHRIHWIKGWLPYRSPHVHPLKSQQNPQDIDGCWPGLNQEFRMPSYAQQVRRWDHHPQISSDLVPLEGCDSATWRAVAPGDWSDLAKWKSSGWGYYKIKELKYTIITWDLFLTIIWDG